jgi:hypothetical protein
VDARIGPVTTARDGSYVVEVGPAFAVPGQASVELTVSGLTDPITGGTLRFTLGVPPHDTLRLDADVGAERGSC